MNVEKYNSLWQAMNLDAVPTIYTFKGGKFQDRIIGLQTEEKYVEFFEQDF